MMKCVITPKVNKDGKIMRRVRSFVCHHRKLTINQKNALQILWPKLGVDFNNHPLFFNSLFGNNAPVILEIGFGMGASLITMTKQNPNKNFLGIEVYAPGISACLTAANEAKLSNLRIIYHDAVEVLEKMLLENSLNMVLLFFPDPWHKTRHNKRRIVQKYFAKLILSKLKLGGVFHIVTDWQPYASHILNVMYTINDYQNVSISGDYIERPILRPVTKFENRSQQLGHNIYELMFKKIK